MAYQSHTWTAGETVTAAKLNNMEQGIANNGFLIGTINRSNGNIIVSLTWQEIYNSINNGVLVFFIENNVGLDVYYVKSIYVDQDTYTVLINTGSSVEWFTTNSSSGYPILVQK